MVIKFHISLKLDYGNKIPYFIKITILKINCRLQKLNNRKKYLK